MLREEAIEKLELMRQKVDEETYRALILAIKALEQKSKTGHWIYDETIENWRCSKCNETPKTMGYCGTADFMAKHFKFCNHCGAYMVEPQEKQCADCNHYGKLSLDCSRCDDDCSMFEPQESEEQTDAT